MSIKDFGFWFRDFWNDFKKEKSGLVGLGIIAVSILVVILEPFCLSWDETNTKWRDISYWQDNSPSAPPAWTNAFNAKKSAVTAKLMGGKHEEAELDGGVKLVTTSYDYNFTADEAPLDLIFHCRGTGDNINVKFDVTRPDGETIELAQRLEQGIQNADIRLSAENDGRDAAFGFLKTHESEANLASLSSESLRATEIIFNTARDGMTSNAGARDLGKNLIGFGEQGKGDTAIQDAVERAFTPEFRNRLDAVVRFESLPPAIIERIVTKSLDEFRVQLAEKHVELETTDALIKHLAEKGYSREFGARNISRLIEDKIKTFFVDEVLFGRLSNGGKALADVKDGEILISVV